MAKQSLDPDRPFALPVLLTRPEAQGRAFAQRLVGRFGAKVRPVFSPLMVPSFLTSEMPKGDFATVIFTSSTAVAAAVPLRADLPKRAYCVGDQTAQAASAAGFDATSADGDAEALLTTILADPPRGRLLHLRGENTRGSLADRLTAAGIPTTDLVVYRQDPQPISPEALALLQAPGAVILPLFSPRSADLFAKALPANSKAQLYLAAFSPAVAQSVTCPHVRLVTAARPDADAMLEAIAELIVAASPP